VSIVHTMMNRTENMLAATYDHYGPPEVLELKTVPIPDYGNEDVLIKVHFSTVNRTDCGFLRAEPAIVRLIAGLTKPKNTILGSEFSGEVVATGSAVSDYQAGDRVFGFKDDDYGFGGHAQFTSMSVNGLMAKIPDHLSFADAAPALDGAHYALQAIRATQIQKAQRVLINGATGSIGSAALQIICSMDVNVTAVCATPHEQAMRDLGAQKTIDYLNEDFTHVNEHYDVVLDAVGKSSFGRCKQILTKRGRYTSSELGAYCQNPILALLTPVLSQQRVHFPIPKNSRSDADYLLGLMQNRQYQPLIDRTFSLENIREAFNYVETGEKIGNVLLEIPQ